VTAGFLGETPSFHHFPSIPGIFFSPLTVSPCFIAFLFTSYLVCSILSARIKKDQKSSSAQAKQSNKADEIETTKHAIQKHKT
jgi:hypothetical protein